MPRRSLHKAARLFIRHDNATEAADLRHHVGQGRALVSGQARQGFAAILDHLTDCLSLAHIGQTQQMQNDILRLDACRKPAIEPHTACPGDFNAHFSRHPCVRHLGRADTKGQSPQCAAVGRMGVGADDQLTRPNVTLGHDRMADAFRAVTVRKVVVQTQPVRFAELLLNLGQCLSRFEQPSRAPLG